VKVGDYIHIQWTGADSNPAGNAGQGRQMTDRSNIVQIESLNHNYPLTFDEVTMFIDPDGGGPHKELIHYLAYLGQTGCNPDAQNANDLDNCKGN
jgi:hypothetical protein